MTDSTKTTETSRLSDPADRLAGLDQFRSRRAGRFTLDDLIDFFTRHPDATAASGEAGLLAAYINELRRELGAQQDHQA